jgi:hypothetical protein
VTGRRRAPPLMRALPRSLRGSGSSSSTRSAWGQTGQARDWSSRSSHAWDETSRPTFGAVSRHRTRRPVRFVPGRSAAGSLSAVRKMADDRNPRSALRAPASPRNRVGGIWTPESSRQPFSAPRRERPRPRLRAGRSTCRPVPTFAAMQPREGQAAASQGLSRAGTRRPCSPRHARIFCRSARHAIVTQQPARNALRTGARLLRPHADTRAASCRTAAHGNPADRVTGPPAAQS